MATTTHRNSMIGQIHGLKKTLGLSDDSYRTLLLCHSGKTSCSQMDDNALERVVSAFKRMSKQENPDPVMSFPVSIQIPATRPTRRQWEALDALAKSIGWDGLHDSRLLAFAARTSTAYALKEMTRKQVSQCITGLTHWHKQRQSKEQQQ